MNDYQQDDPRNEREDVPYPAHGGGPPQQRFANNVPQQQPVQQDQRWLPSMQPPVQQQNGREDYLSGDLTRAMMVLQQGGDSLHLNLQTISRIREFAEAIAMQRQCSVPDACRHLRDLMEIMADDRAIEIIVILTR